jgi:archaellum biogenesis ATPase FlaH
MEKQELIQRSPVRIFEKSIHGGLQAGEVGLIASQSGIGKTSVLVQIALDKLLQEKKVIHVSFNQHSDYVLGWYEDIFNEFVSRKNLENAANVKGDLVRNRVLMNFSQEGMTGDQILKSLKAMIVDGGFKAEAIIIDGFNFANMERERLEKFKAFSKEQNIEIWYSCTVKAEAGQYDKQNIPLVIKELLDLIEVIIVLEPRPDHISLSVPKDRSTYNPEHMALRLDPKTLLIQED